MEVTIHLDDQSIQKIAEQIASLIPVAPQKMTLTTEEVAQELSTYPAKISLWRREGLLPGIRSGNTWIFRRKTVERFLEIYEGLEIGTEEKCRKVKK